MALRIEPDSHIPVYLQIVAGVRSAIGAGVYKPEDALPSLRAMAIELRVNPNTVQRAYDELCRQGLIESQRGRGIFVSRRARSIARKQATDDTRASLIETGHKATSAGLGATEIQDLFAVSLDCVLDRSLDSSDQIRS